MNFILIFTYVLELKFSMQIYIINKSDTFRRIGKVSESFCLLRILYLSSLWCFPS